MSIVATTKMSSKGQVVIPEAVRKAYDWRPGMSFVVTGRDNAVILQPVTAPDTAQFDDLLAKERMAASPKRKSALDALGYALQFLPPDAPRSSDEMLAYLREGEGD